MNFCAKNVFWPLTLISEKTAPYFLLTTKLFWKYEHCRVEWYMTQPSLVLKVY
jgi:hypothetical protein